MTYLDTLQSAWMDHVAPRAEDAPTVISLFAGCGGSSLGYSMAGYRELLAVEWDANAVATFRLNFPDVPVYHGDIASLSVEECLSLAAVAPGELDVLDGSPPCQGFSTAGKREMGDDRNQLFHEFTRLLAGLQPRAFVMENVAGLVEGKMRLLFVDILRELKDCGYYVTARKLNAMYFDVPQRRERLIFIGARKDLGASPSHPLAVSRPIPMRSVLPITTARYDTHGRFTKRSFQPGRDVLPTITKHSVYHLPMRVGQDPEERYLSTDEAKVFASFPPLFRLIGSKQDGYDRIGNSVPPLFMRAIAAHVSRRLLTRVEAARG